MSSAALYEELDLAVEAMLAEQELATDESTLLELMGVAQDLRLAPRADFRSELLASLQVDPVAITVPPPFLPTPSSAARSRSFTTSALMHVAALLLVFSRARMVQTAKVIAPSPARVVLVDPDLSDIGTRPVRGGGGGGDADRIEAPKGAAPRFAAEQITPPAIVVRNEQPKLKAEPTVVGDPGTVLSKLDHLGDPLTGVLGPASNGIGAGSGIGSGSGTGIGAGKGSGVGPGYGGGFGGGVYRVGNGVSAPRLVFDPEPQYSEEARKAKQQGVVLLEVIVGSDGRVHKATVARALGMGLDQKAIEAVQGWRFEPATKDGVPVWVKVNIEVNFHLY